ncbi:nucleotide-binding universal stress UspA family protein [Wenyingzhuangia heitensis]|uniref:Nucleotide-binding universal stress UspA family protein n=1 Tax=Wenyingzhuangia heitensis TaxID=1487859 RepID=A0ABX0UC20_9FLAO|nr:universal stress protein [Wenyingzhuangia heitensis]NIJ46380.1 nucleotide-binding universal stress UspA family protein [Wenyingzhuangia heitensis]
MKNIIIPVDFSKYSEFALKTASKLAKKHKTKLILVHMLEMPTGYSDHDSNYGKTLVFLIKYAEKKMEAFLKKEYLEGVTIKVIIKHFTLFQEVGNLAAEQDASLIVMGSHGISEHNDTFLGSNTEKVVRSSPIPVLIVKEEVESVDFEKSVFVSDFKMESIEAYKKAQMFYKTLGIKPTLLFINKPDGGFVSTNEMKARFENFLMKADGNLDNLSNFDNYDDYTVAAGVKYYANENNISLISVATHGKSSLSKFFNKSISLDIANKSTRPVLTVLI